MALMGVVGVEFYLPTVVQLDRGVRYQHKNNIEK
jgi:hypothetical protein